eukprot:Plantae.Rhodophyta-Hildenbrandia_rubra.ctg7991.p1 GENE.Plantae.Rhodophyta-Hildenbrandia_rubra.ctg7991~~Plantae.Rhodophyta-Hildenbrandia_rubra.ctg7991.p1  ORF type:complete len:340 (+),score=38.69 Plantae.Rhodophyta-Hildenbrandia_rubra.ctg7991:312-1331(+)
MAPKLSSVANQSKALNDLNFLSSSLQGMNKISKNGSEENHGAKFGDGKLRTLDMMLMDIVASLDACTRKAFLGNFERAHTSLDRILSTVLEERYTVDKVTTDNLGVKEKEQNVEVQRATDEEIYEATPQFIKAPLVLRTAIPSPVFLIGGNTIPCGNAANGGGASLETGLERKPSLRPQKRNSCALSEALPVTGAVKQPLVLPPISQIFNGEIVHRSHSSKNYTGAPPSVHCHICCRSAAKQPLLPCVKNREWRCRKSVCQRCFLAIGGRDWNGAMSYGWICCHCRNVCPPNAQCFVYKKTNQKRRMKARATRNSNASTALEQYSNAWNDSNRHMGSTS